MKCSITDQNTRTYHVNTDIKASACVCVSDQTTAAHLICKLTRRRPSVGVHANYMRCAPLPASFFKVPLRDLHGVHRVRNSAPNKSILQLLSAGWDHHSMC